MGEHFDLQDYDLKFQEVFDSLMAHEIDEELAERMRSSVIPIGELTPKQAREQKINFCLGMVSRNSGITREDIERMVDAGPH